MNWNTKMKAVLERRSQEWITNRLKEDMVREMLQSLDPKFRQTINSLLADCFLAGAVIALKTSIEP